jgi:hypothetical protein
MKPLIRKTRFFAITLVIASLLLTNRIQAQNTGLLSPTTSSNIGGITTAANGLTSNNVYVAFTTNGNGAGYGGFSLTTANGGPIPIGSSIFGIEVQLEGNETNGATRDLAISLTWNNGTTYTTAITMAQYTSTTDALRTVPATGGSTNTWGHAWTVDELSNANFGVRCLVPAAATGTVNLDQVLVRVYYCAPPSAPSVTTPVNYCINTTAVPLTATGTGLLWYAAASGGTGSSTAPTPVTTATGTTSYYVSQTVGCESPRAQIVVNVNSLPSASVTSQTNISCNAGNDGTITVTASGGSGTYKFAASTDGSTFNWLPATYTISPYQITGLNATQPYRIKVQDSNGCVSK